MYPQGACRIRKAAKPPTAAQYFKIFKPISWGERPAERRSRLIQRFPRHSRRTCRLSSLSLRGAKRRGNLAVPYRISRKLRRNRNCLPEIAALACGLLAMAHQGGVAVHQRPHTVEYPCTRRSLTAAAGTRYKRFVRFDRRPVHIGSAGPFSTKQCCFFPQT